MRKLSRRDAVRLLTLGATAPCALTIAIAAAEEVPLAMRGYDPVAYFTLGRPTPGLPDIAFDWDERRYLFARIEHRDLFKADPIRYAPQFANYCAMSLTRGEMEEGKPEYWLIREGKLYLFGKPFGPEVFQQTYAENVAKATENRWMVQRH